MHSCHRRRHWRGLSGLVCRFGADHLDV